MSFRTLLAAACDPAPARDAILKLSLFVNEGLAKPSELVLVLSKFDEIWSLPKLIKAEEDNHIPQSQTPFFPFFLCVIGVVACLDSNTYTISPPLASRLKSRLLGLWNQTIARWFALIEKTCLSNSYTDRTLEDRRFIFALIVQLTTVLREFNPQFSAQVLSNTSAQGFVLRLWSLEVTDSQFYPSSPEAPCYSNILLSFLTTLASHANNPTPKWEDTFLVKLSNDPHHIAKIVLLHVKLALNSPNHVLDYKGIDLSFRITALLSTYKPLTYALLAQQSMKLATRAIFKLSSAPFDTETCHIVGAALGSCWWYITAFVQTSDGVPLVKDMTTWLPPS